MKKIACVDIGGTNIKSGLLGQDGQLTDVAEVPTEAHLGGHSVVEKAAAIIKSYVGEIECAGISTAGEVDFQDGSIKLADNLPGYTGLPVRALLEKACGIPIAVENDVNAAAIGEMNYGAGKGMKNVLVLTYGTGIGGAAIVGGRLYYGHSGSAGEIGGLITHPEAVVSGNVGTGSYEQYASATALVALVQKVAPAIQNGRELFANMHNPAIKAAFEEWVCEVCWGLVGVIHSFEPEAVLLGGGIMQEPSACAAIEKKLTPLLKASFRHCKILPASLGNNASLYGAGMLAKELIAY